jgi:general secretion pathway protein F
VPALESYAYRAVDDVGRRTRGVTEAESAERLTRSLEARGLVVIDVERVRNAGVAGERGGRVPKRDVLELTRALAALLAAGLPLARALHTAAHIVPERVRIVLDDLRARTARGESLAAALDAHQREFSPMYRGVVRAGERGSDLPGAFAALSVQLEAEDRLRARLVAASIYPLLLAVGGIITCTVLVMVVLPRFAELLSGAQAGLPRSTATLLAIAATLRRAGPALLLVGLSLIIAIGMTRHSAPMRRMWSRLLVRLPIVGQLRRYTLGARFSRLTSVLLVGGAPLLQALDDVIASIADPVARESIARIRDHVHDGSALHRAVGQSNLFPPVLARLIAVGEESGRLADFLQRAAEFCEERAERALQRLVALIEPAMILVFGVLIAFVALSLLQALYGIDATTLR